MSAAAAVVEVPGLRVCGSLAGADRHRRLGELVCGWCLRAEELHRLEHERRRPLPSEPVGTSSAEVALGEAIGLLAALLEESDRAARARRRWAA